MESFTKLSDLLKVNVFERSLSQDYVVGVVQPASRDNELSVKVLINPDNVDSLDNSLKAAFNDYSAVVLDMANVTYASPSFWGVILGYTASSEELGKDFVLINLRNPVFNDFERIGFDNFLRNEETLDDALDYLKWKNNL